MKYALKLALRSIRYRRSTLLLCATSVSLSVILLMGVERLRSKVHESFTSTISGTDLIVGARTGNVPLLLSTVFHIGYPTQNVDWETYESISSLPQVSWTIPLSLGDSHKGYSVIGTKPSFFDHFRYGNDQEIRARSGKKNIEGMNCVLGAKAAKDLGYRIGDKLVVTHGMGSEEFIRHDDVPFIISGILYATGTPVDQAVFVSLYAMDEIHSHFYDDDPDVHDVFSNVHDNLQALDHSHEDDHSPEHESDPISISGFFVGLKNPTDILATQRMINTYEDEPLTAIMPVVTLFDLWEIVRPIERTLIIISALVLFVALGGILTTVLTSLNERRREMAILRSVGAKPKHIFGLILMEIIGIISIGTLTGVLVLHFALLLSKPFIAKKLGVFIQLGWFSMNEILLLLIILLLGGLIGLMPAYQSYRNTLADGLAIKK